jgi:hypothetical protein
MPKLFELPNATTLDEILVQTESSVTAFTPLLLAFVFFVVFLGGVARQKSRTGTSDYATWSVVASLSTFMIALIMTLVEGLINLDWLIAVVVVVIFSGVWLFLDRRSSEV